MTIRVVYAGRKLTVKVPRGTDEVSIEVPPQNGGNGQEKEKPLIVLTDRT